MKKYLIISAIIILMPVMVAVVLGVALLATLPLVASQYFYFIYLIASSWYIGITLFFLVSIPLGIWGYKMDSNHHYNSDVEAIKRSLPNY